MAVKNTYSILLIAGQYDVTSEVLIALDDARFSLQTAFNHRDAMYVLSRNAFDALVVDARMVDRHSSIATVAALAKEYPRVPLVVFAPDEGEVPHPSAAVIRDLLPRNIRLAMMQVLNITIPERPPDLEVRLTEARMVRENEANDDEVTRRLEAITRLFDLGRSLTEVLDLGEVLNRVVAAARDLTRSEEGVILLPEDEELYLRAKVGIDLETARNFRIKIKDTLAGEVFRTGRPVLVGADKLHEIKSEYFVKALLYVPILMHDEVIGVLGVSNRDKDDTFNQEHQQLLERLAPLAAVAIENARIHNESLERARELETLVASSQIVNSSLLMGEALPNICRQLASILNVGYAEIYDWNRETNRLCPSARYYRSSWRASYRPRLYTDYFKALGAAVDNNQYMLLTRQDTDYPGELAYMDEVGVVAMLIIPLCLDDKVMGAVRAYFVSLPDLPFPVDVIEQIQEMLLEELVDPANRIDQLMSDNLFPIAGHINTLAASDWCELILTANNGRELVLQARAGHGVWLNAPSPCIDLNDYPDVVRTLRAQEFLNVNASDPHIAIGGRLFLERTQARSVLGVPLVQRSRTQGLVIVADTEQNRVFNPREIEMAQAIVGQAAIALENANLVRDLEISLQELKNRQDRLVRTARLSAMGELAAVVAHQINNPLTTIIVDTEMMLMDEPKDSYNYSSLTAIARAGNRAANVARRLLSIARPTDPETPTDLVDVLETVKEVISMLQAYIERNGIRIVQRFPDKPLPKVKAVKGRLEDVWHNLLMNANDALLTEEGKKREILIQVQHAADANVVEVMVRDNGPGIPDNIIHQIFSPFFTTKAVGEGTGLGLHVSREIVENVGGQILVESVPGSYASFLVRLPVADL
ncbi:MAG: hypothetical protein OHK0046_02870 [Anaerolineae bacterium]